MSGPLTETSNALTWSYDRRDDRIRTCDPLTPRSTQPCRSADDLRRDRASFSAAGAGLSSALSSPLSSPLSSLEAGQGLGPTLPSPPLPLGPSRVVAVLALSAALDFGVPVTDWMCLGL
jgi:hypothetical protein